MINNIKLTYRYFCNDCNARYKFKLTPLEAQNKFSCNYCDNAYITHNLKTNNNLLHRLVHFICKYTR